MTLRRSISESAPWVVAVAASAGGIHALPVLVGQLPSDLPACLLIVQHLARHQASRLPQILARYTALEVAHARTGDQTKPGSVLIAPPDRHMVLSAGKRIVLIDTELVNYVRPAADVLFASVAQHYGSRALGIVLTGSGRDGAAGALRIHKAGGIVIAQDKATSQHFSMPGSAIRAAATDYVLPLDDISSKLIELVTQ